MAWFSKLFSGKTPSPMVNDDLDDIGDGAITAEQIATARRTKSQFKGLSDEAIQLAVKQPPMWEYRLFFQTLIDEVDGYESLRQARALGFMPGISESVPDEHIFLWMRTRSDEAKELAEQFGMLINRDLQEAFGAPGQPGDVSAVIIVSRKLGLIYKQFLEISIQCLKAQHAPVFDGMFREMSKINDDVIKAFEEFPQNALISLMKALKASSNTKQNLNLVMVLSVDTEPLLAEIDKAEEALFHEH